MKSSKNEQASNNKRWKQIRKLGERTAQNLGIKSEEDVDRIIHELREEKGKNNSTSDT